MLVTRDGSCRAFCCIVCTMPSPKVNCFAAPFGWYSILEA